MVYFLSSCVVRVSVWGDVTWFTAYEWNMVQSADLLHRIANRIIYDAISRWSGPMSRLKGDGALKKRVVLAATVTYVYMTGASYVATCYNWSCSLTSCLLLWWHDVNISWLMCHCFICQLTITTRFIKARFHWDQFLVTSSWHFNFLADLLATSPASS